MRNQKETKKDLFVTCSPGLEPLLAQELAEMGFETSQQYCGVYVRQHSLEAIYRINYNSRLASRVLMPLIDFRCQGPQDLYRAISSIDWQYYLPHGKTIAIDANVHHPYLRNSLYAAQVAKDAICDQMRDRTGSRPSINPSDPDIQLNLFIHDHFGNLSYDTSGAPLFKRGYRQGSVEAPLRESLAAAFLKLAHYQGDELLYDPCCGSGTILIEAALIASHTPPGFLRQKWGFMLLPDFSSEAWLKVKNESDKKRCALPKGRLFGADLNKTAVHAAKINARAAGFHQTIEVLQGDFREYAPACAPTFVMTNPPHGHRLDDVQFLRPLYRALGDFMKQKTAKPARGFVFTGSMELSKEVGLAAKQRHVIDNSGIESRLLEFDLY